ncbi:DUF4226 domain-containing protein [Nocardia asteroides]|uniref:DUF4226 domain-containing protein n=1 Tax=Nocardia asteroides TaxID=1824 RepID=UPI001E2DBB1E|nr:DUF4226 domain-containing protein [Nocardia asteroides]UGT63360.1 DUF4226 domain-containing protein [Nocardia asteroides]
MTSAGLRPGDGAEAVASVDTEVVVDETATVTVTPWSPRGERRAALPVRPGAPAEPQVTPVAATNPLPANQFPALAGITAPSALLRQAVPTGTALPAPVTAAAPAASPLGTGTGTATGTGFAPGRAREDDDTETPDGSPAPANTAMDLLPTLADALSKLGGGSSGAAPAAIPAGHTTTTTADVAPAATGLSPQAESALRLLKSLAAAYGDGDTKDPEVVALRKELGGTTGTPTTVAARRLYQANFANAYNTLDNQLAGYITRTAGTHKVDRTTINNLLREVNIAINELGAQAYTRQGQQQIHKILTAALVKANAIAGNTNTGNTDTATFINQLTGQYLNNIAGRKTPDTTSAGGLPGGKVGDWIAQAVQILRAMGYDPSKIDPAALAIIAEHESGNNPGAVNNWDSNAAKGIPSKGLMQTIGPTFDRWAVDGHRNIMNPVDNIVAAARYAVNRYGSVSNVPGVVAVRSGRKYVGY